MTKETKQQTTVDWIQQQIRTKGITHDLSIGEILDKAKEMEKEQMTNAIVESMKNKFRVYTESGLEHFIEIAQQYYNETYGGNK
jgi:SOS-response transcriptional repressor LexA